MKTHKIILIVVFTIFSVFAFAQLGGNYEITKSTIDGGGGLSSSGNFSVAGSVGQTDASAELSGGSYALRGGFWPSRVNNDLIFKNGFE